MNKISFVLPIIRKDSLLAQTCVYSVFTLFNNNDIEKFYIITNPNDVEYFQNIFGRYGNIIQVINETDIYQNRIRFTGWHMQQVLKLYISNYITTEHYIILDADCYLTKRIGYADLFVYGKPIVNITHKHANDWLLQSCKYFGLDYEKVSEDIINVTPQLCTTRFVRELCATNNNIPELIYNGCNEFWLYYCYILKNYNFNDYFHVDKEKRLANHFIWIKEHLVNNSIEDTINSQFNDPSTLFTLFQSNMHIDPQLYLPFINERIFKT